MLKLFGTLTSPFVRRVRIVAEELGVPYELVDTTTDAGQAELRARSPIWKVPVVELDGELIFDSRQIIDVLLERHGPGPFRVEPVSRRIAAENFMFVVEAALESAIKRFYLDRDKADVAGAEIMVKDQARIAACLKWLDARCEGGLVDGEASFGRPELVLLTALEWFRFRKTVDITPYPHLAAAMKRWWDRPSVVNTAPPGSRA